MTKHNMSLSVDFELDPSKLGDVEKFKRHLFQRCLDAALELIQSDFVEKNVFVSVSVTDTVEE